MRKKENAYKLESKTLFVDVTYVEYHKESTKNLLSDFYQGHGIQGQHANINLFLHTKKTIPFIEYHQ